MLFHCYMGRTKRIWYLSPMRAAKVQASLRIRAVSPEPPLLAHTSSESRGTFRQKARSLAPLNGWACAVKVCHDGMLEDTNSLGAAHMVSVVTDKVILLFYHLFIHSSWFLCLSRNKTGYWSVYFSFWLGHLTQFLRIFVWHFSLKAWRRLTSVSILIIDTWVYTNTWGYSRGVMHLTLWTYY